MLKTGEMLKMLKLENPILQHFPGNVEDVEVAGEILPPPPLQNSPCNFNILNIFNISGEMLKFWVF